MLNTITVSAPNARYLPLPRSRPNDFAISSCGSYVVIQLHGGLVGYCDTADWQHLCNYRWYAHRRARGAYYLYCNCLYASTGKRTAAPMQAMLLGTNKHTVADHKRSGDTHDNRRENIRLVPQSSNVRRQRKGERGTSRYRGVSRTRGGRWAVFIASHYVSTHDTEQQAAAAWNAAAYERWGKHDPNFDAYNDVPTFADLGGVA